jgi:hypothetical protein
MTDEPTVTSEYGMCCPKCGEDDRIHICATVWVKLYDDGTDLPESGDGDTEWTDESPCKCNHCDQTGNVRDFTLPEEGGAS